LEALKERISELERDEGKPRQVQGTYGEMTDRSFSQRAPLHEAVFVIFDRKLEFINDRFAELFGISTEEVCSSNLDPMTLIAPESRRFIRELYREACCGAFTTKQIHFLGLSKNGPKVACEALLLCIPYKWGIALQGSLRGVSVGRRIDEAMQRRYSDFPVAINAVPLEVLHAEKAPVQDLLDDKEEMPVRNLFNTFAHNHSPNAASRF
jgi:PAS domain-containing protein